MLLRRVRGRLITRGSFGGMCECVGPYNAQGHVGGLPIGGGGGSLTGSRVACRRAPTVHAARTSQTFKDRPIVKFLSSVCRNLTLLAVSSCFK